MGRNHPNLRSVNAAFFDAFLTQLQSEFTSSAPRGVSQEDLLRIMRLAALTETARRISQRRVYPDLWPPGEAFIDTSDDGKSMSVFDDRGNGRGLNETAKALIREELRRLTRGMPHWLPKLWEFLP